MAYGTPFAWELYSNYFYLEKLSATSGLQRRFASYAFLALLMLADLILVGGCRGAGCPTRPGCLIYSPPFYVVNMGIYMFGGGGLRVGVWVCMCVSVCVCVCVFAYRSSFRLIVRGRSIEFIVSVLLK